MRLIKCMHTDSACYKANNVVTPVGIVVHSTGANNPSIKRYSQPSTDDPKRTELLNLIGKNSYNNHWNRSSVEKSAHYFIGKLADGSVATVQNLPETIAAWGVGKGKKGSYNYAPTAHIQFEVCEDNLSNQDYYEKVINEAMDLCADICFRHGWNSDVIVSHKECYKLGYGSNHGDIDHWLAKYGHDMNYFRTCVQTRINQLKNPTKPEEPYVPAVGDIVDFTGTVHYRSSNATTQYKCTPGLAKVKQIYNGKHPYNCVAVKGTSTVCGWVDAEFVKKYDGATEQPKEEVKEEVKEEPVVTPEVETPVVEPKDPVVTDEPKVEPTPEVTPEDPKKDVVEPTPVVPDIDPKDRTILEIIFNLLKKLLGK